MTETRTCLTAVRFGTDGWRGKIAADFTFSNVRLVTQALVNYLLKNKLVKKGIAVGYDHRFQSEDFAKVAAEICSGAGVNTYLSQFPISSPTLSLAVQSQGLGAGIMITASHNPPEWNGFKIKESFGGSAFPETTQQVESFLQDKLQIVPATSNIEIFDPRPAYFAKVASLVDLELIKSHKLKIIIDCLYGSGAGYFKALGLPVIEIREKRDPLFGGINPEPIPINLAESISFVKETAGQFANEITAGIVLDGDADRLAAIDATGRFINTHNVFTLLLRHLFLHRKWRGKVVKTFNLSNLIDKLCRSYQLPITVTPIGFKYIARLMLTEKVLLGGEESGGMGIQGFIPERDGVLAGLMLLELLAYEKRSLAQILDEIMKQHGYFYYDRLDLHTTKAQTVVKEMTTKPPHEFAGRPVVKVEQLDGLKLNFADESWILFRASGTEPLLRIYTEARSENETKILLASGEKLVSTF